MPKKQPHSLKVYTSNLNHPEIEAPSPETSNRTRQRGRWSALGDGGRGAEGLAFGGLGGAKRHPFDRLRIRLYVRADWRFRRQRSMEAQVKGKERDAAFKKTRNPLTKR